MELKRYARLLRKWWWLLLLATLLATVSSYFAVSRQLPVYQARTTLILGRAIEDPNPSGTELNLGQELAALYADIANRQIVRDSTREALGLERLPEYEARPIPNSQLIEIVVTDTNPERAQAVANELANQLILQSPTAPQPEEQERQAFIDDQLTSLQNNIEGTEADIADLQIQLESAFSAREIEDLQQQITALQNKLTTLQSNYAALYSKTQGGAINALTILEPASRPLRPVGGGGLMTVLTASMIGFVLAAGAVYLLDTLDDTIKSPDDIRIYTRLPALPGIADFGAQEDQPELITRTEPLSPIAEAYRALRTAIKASSPEGRSLLITSPRPNEGKSVTAGNLAVVMAQAGHRVLLIDADLRRPIQHKLFNLRRGRGLSDLLLVLHLNGRFGDLDALLDDVIQDTAEHGLSLLASGEQAPNVHTLFGSDAMSALLAKLQERFDYLIVDSPPVLAVSDAVMLSTLLDDVIVIADAGRIRRGQLKQAIERLQEVRAKIMGISLNRVNPKTEGYYSPYYEYYAIDTPESGRKGQGLNGKGNKEWLARWTRRVAADDDRL